MNDGGAVDPKNGSKGRDADPAAIRAIVVDDDPLARRMIKDALRRAEIVVIAEARDGRQAVELTLHYRPDIVLMDVVMPQLDGIAATRRILEEIPNQLIVMLTSGDDDEMAVISLRAGAIGYLSKALDIDVLPRALMGALSGEAAISRRLTKRLVDDLRRRSEGMGGLRPVRSTLTPREWEVVDLLTEHKTTDEIADALVVSPETVRTHVKHILRKLNVRSREDAIAAVDRIRGGDA